MVTFIGVRNDERCTVGYYTPGAATDFTGQLSGAPIVDVDNFTITLSSAFDGGDTVVLVPLDGCTLPTPWTEGTLYTLQQGVSSDLFFLLDRTGTMVPPTAAGAGRMRVIKITELENSRSIAKANEYEWGYIGFNPQQLAYDLIVQTDVLWNINITEPTPESFAFAQSKYEDFAMDVVAKFPHKFWTLDYKNVVAWLERNIQVTADFAVSSVAGNVNTTTFVYYPLVSGYNLEYIWGFGDGGSSNDEQPTHVYTTDDKRFTVTLSVRNSWQFDSRFREDYITIGDPPAVVLA